MIVAGLVTVVVPLADCTSCTVYCSYGTAHDASVSVKMARIYFMMVFIAVLIKSQAGCMCYIVVCINCLPGSFVTMKALHYVQWCDTSC